MQALEKKNLKRQKKEDQEEEEEKQLFLNPLLAFKKTKDDKKDSESEWSDDDKYEPKMTKEEKRAKREKERKLLGKRKRAGIQGDIDEVKDFFNDNQIEEVPVNDLEKQAKDDDSDGLPSGYSSMDSDEIAETRALAKKMLRKKFREETINSSWSRIAFDEDER